MLKVWLAVFIVSASCTSPGLAECERGWILYNDESCIKAFDDLLTYDEAKNFCASQENADSMATLVMVKEAELQELLANYTADQFDSFWLGGRYDDQSSQYKWEDGDPLTYTNWADGFPRNNTDSSSCIQFVPVNAKDGSRLDGKWQDAACQRRNLAMCQRPLPWTTRAIRKLQKELESLDSRFFPIGFIYIEYSNQSCPVTLWPGFTWEDVTENYAGLFFRALGGGSEGWGETQANCSPQITQVMGGRTIGSGAYVNPVTLPPEGWSQWGWAGASYPSGGGTHRIDLLRYNIKKCEVRPNNQAVRIWKRIA